MKFIREAIGMLKKYDVTIYGRKNTIIGAIRNERLYYELVIANSKKEAITEAFKNFHIFIDEPWATLITRRDVRIECEYVSWLIPLGDDEETLYINEMLR